VNSSSASQADVEDLVTAYRADLVAAGMFAGHPVTSVARTFFDRVGVQVGRGCRSRPSAHCR
jgi:hypothetical protein